MDKEDLISLIAGCLDVAQAVADRAKQEGHESCCLNAVAKALYELYDVIAKEEQELLDAKTQNNSAIS